MWDYMGNLHLILWGKMRLETKIDAILPFLIKYGRNMLQSVGDSTVGFQEAPFSGVYFLNNLCAAANPAQSSRTLAVPYVLSALQVCLLLNPTRALFLKSHYYVPVCRRGNWGTGARTPRLWFPEWKLTERRFEPRWFGARAWATPRAGAVRTAASFGTFKALSQLD